MNAYVTYEEDDHDVVIRKVFVGEGNIRLLQKAFNEDVLKNFGPQPELLKHVNGITIHDAEAEQLLYNWRAQVFAAKSPHKFGEWLVATKGWTECEDVNQESI